MPKWYKPQLNEVGSVWLQPSAEMARELSVDALRRALEAAGVEFTNGDQPGVRLTRAAAARSAEAAAASKPPAATKAIRSQTANTLRKKR
jgi:hypothetical protein